MQTGELLVFVLASKDTAGHQSIQTQNLTAAARRVGYGRNPISVGAARLRVSRAAAINGTNLARTCPSHGTQCHILTTAARFASSGAMPKPSFELDPREVEEFVRPLPARQQLVYRLAVRGLCARCRGDRQFQQRTDALVERFRKDLPAVLKEGDKLSDELTASVAGR
jgi:hypothetical protein